MSERDPSASAPYAGAPPDEQDVPPNPREARLKQLGRGPYYVAPDSAEAIPDRIWRRLDPDDVEAAAKSTASKLEQELDVGDRDNPNGPIPRANFLPAKSRQLLQELGGPVAARVLGEIQTGRDQVPTADTPP